jgi:hypothetical protein
VTLMGVAERITTGVQRVAQVEVVEERIARLKRIEFDANQVRPMLAEAIGLLEAATSAGLSIKYDSLGTLRSRIAAALHPVDRAIEPSALEQLLADLRAEASAIKGAVTVMWQELVDRKIPQRQGLTQLAEALLRLDPGDALALELREAIGVVQQLSHMPPTIEGLRRLDALATRVPQVLSDLVGDDPSVRSFAERVGSGGAPLEALTAEVRSWIESRGLSRAFMIVPGRAGS